MRLTASERQTLNLVIKKLSGRSQKVRRACILLKADADGPTWTDEKIAEACSARTRTIERIRQRFVECGFEETLNGKRREKPPTEKLLDGQQSQDHCDAAWGATGWLCQLVSRPQRVDDEYERAGTADIFLFTEPLSGWREATARERKTKVDGAIEVARLLEGHYANCPQCILVSDNLNTHTKGAFYEAFDPERARALVRRLQFCHTPQHGSWLNIAENELSSLTRQCLATRRFGDLETLEWEIGAWSDDVTSPQRGVDWHMKIDDARCKLKSIYPKIKP